MVGRAPASKTRPPGGLTSTEWLESSYLIHLVTRVATARGIPSDEMPDLLQEVRIALWQAWGSSPDLLVGPAWIARTADHKAVDALRRISRRRTHDQLAGMLQERSQDKPDLHYLLRAAVSELPHRLRAFYELHYSQGWSERETARRLGLCRASVRWLHELCRRQLHATDR